MLIAARLVIVAIKSEALARELVDGRRAIPIIAKSDASK
jgi:hypothetical protein